MFEIHVSDNDVTGGSIPVSWCVDKEALKFLSDHGCEDPQVVLVVAPGDDNGYHIKKEIRQVVPLKDMMAYVDFKVSGANKIWAFISVNGKYTARNRYLGKTNRNFDSYILNTDGQSFYFEDNPLLAKPVSVDVPKEAFAAEPSNWEKAWVNHFFSDKCVDQCAFRRRRLFAYLVQPFIMFFNMLLRFLCLVGALLIGSRNMSIKPLLHPLSVDIADGVLVISGGSYFIRHLPEDGRMPNTFTSIVSYFVRSFFLLPLMPIILIPIILLAYFGLLLKIGLITLAGCVIVAVLFVIIGFIVDGGISKIISLFEAKVEGYWYLSQDEMDLLVCNGEKKPLTVSELPASKRTLRLRFRDLKSKVCRPFSA